MEWIAYLLVGLISLFFLGACFIPFYMDYLKRKQ